MSQFEINPELNQNGNLHYHGYFVLKDKLKFYKSILPKMKYNGFVKIDLVHNDLQKAMEYCRKDREFMKQLIKESPVPFIHSDKLGKRPLDKVSKSLMDYLEIIDVPTQEETTKELTECILEYKKNE